MSCHAMFDIINSHKQTNLHAKNCLQASVTYAKNIKWTVYMQNRLCDNFVCNKKPKETGHD